MRKQKIISFRIPKELTIGVKQLSPILSYYVGEPAELCVSAAPAAENTITLLGKCAKITYAAKHSFFRLLSILLEHADDGEWSFHEERPFHTIGMMLDTSRGAVPTSSSAARTSAATRTACWRGLGGSSPTTPGRISCALQ